MVAKLPATKEVVEDYRAQVLDGSYEVCDALNVTSACDGIAPAAE
jgi:hypothetical protein